MKLRKQKTKKPLIISFIIILMIITVAASYIYFKQQNDSETTHDNSNPAIKKEVLKKDKNDSSNSQAARESNNTESNVDTSAPAIEKEKDLTPEYEGTSTNNAPTLTGAITHTSVVNSTLIIRTTINQSGITGSCDLTLKNGSKVVSRTVSIAQNPSSSTCEGFDIPVSELSKGNWNITIDITALNRATTLTGAVTV